MAKDRIFDKRIDEILRNESFEKYLDLDDPENTDFELLQKWRVTKNHFEFLEFDKRRLTEE